MAIKRIITKDKSPLAWMKCTECKERNKKGMRFYNTNYSRNKGLFYYYFCTKKCAQIWKLKE